MEFKSEAQKATYDKLSTWMKELFGTFVRAREDFPMFSIVIGSALAYVSVNPWGQNDSTVNTRAYLVSETELVPDLLIFLLKENDHMRFGAFGIDKDNDIFFEHTIVGSGCDKEELKASVLAVVLTADQYDDKIVERWGGVRMLDKLSS